MGLWTLVLFFGVSCLACIPRKVLNNFNTGGGAESEPIFRVRDLTLNQYLGSVNSNIDNNSIYGVCKSVERKIVQCITIYYGCPFDKCPSP